MKRCYIPLFIYSAMFGAFTQMIIWNNFALYSWLPAWFFTWNAPWPSTLDAFHVYQGIHLLCFGLAFYLFSSDLPPVKPLPGLPLILARLHWWLIPALVVAYYVIYNLCYHVIFVHPQYWRYPFG